jgi:hypothetical protein
MQLTPAQAEQLHAVIVAAYNSDELEQVVYFKLGKELFNSVSRGPSDSVAYALIRLAEREGWTEALVRAVYLTRKENAAVRDFVATQFPELVVPTQDANLVKSVSTGISAVVEVVQDRTAPGVVAVIGGFRTAFRATCDKSLVLKKYKALHDRLHTLGGLVRPILDAAEAPKALEGTTLDGPGRARLRAVLLDQFPTRADLEMLLSDSLSQNLDAVAGGSNLMETVFNLIRWAAVDPRGRLQPLLAEAVKQRPHNMELPNLLRQCRPARSVTVAMDTFASQLRREVESARKEAEGLSSQLLEDGWIEMLEEAINRIEQADKGHGPDPLQQAALLFRRVLSEAPRINALLTAAAGDLRLDQLIKAMTDIWTYLEGRPIAANSPVQDIAAGLAALQVLQPRLAGLVQEHLEWQSLDNEFSLAETLPGATLRERFPLWNNVRTRLEKLCALSPQKEWARLMTKLIGELETAGTTGDQDGFGRKFDTFRSVAGDRFFELDSELLKVSEHLSAVSTPLDLLMGLVADGHN